MRTVLAVDAFGGIGPDTDAEQLTVRVFRSPFEVEKMRVARPLQLSAGDLPAWNTPDSVRARGRKVRDSLQSHPGVANVLAQLYATPVGQSRPLLVMLSESDAELINWEALCDPKDQFIALDPRWPIGRIIDPAGGSPLMPAELTLPVRMLAVISAFGIHGQAKEWHMIREAVLAARKAGLPITMKVMVGQTALREAIDEEVAGGLTDVEVAAIEATATRLVREIVDWSPQIVHFFCHGRSDAGVQFIELATALDYLNGEDAGSVKVDVKQLVGMSLQLSNPWLLALNCCSSGQAAKNLQSMAHQVVAAGFPAAVAMLEPVDAGDAHEFSRMFYRSLFGLVARVAATLEANPRASVEWTDAMVDARNAVCDLHGGDAPNRGEWTLPVLYVRGPDAFTFERAKGLADTDDYKRRARLVSEWITTVGRQSSEDQRRSVIERVLKDVPRSFWPSADGSFPT